MVGNPALAIAKTVRILENIMVVGLREKYTPNRRCWVLGVWVWGYSPYPYIPTWHYVATRDRHARGFMYTHFRRHSPRWYFGSAEMHVHFLIMWLRSSRNLRQTEELRRLIVCHQKDKIGPLTLYDRRAASVVVQCMNFWGFAGHRSWNVLRMQAPIHVIENVSAFRCSI